MQPSIQEDIYYGVYPATFQLHFHAYLHLNIRMCDFSLKISCSFPSNLTQTQYVKIETIHFLLLFVRFSQLVEYTNIPSYQFDVLLIVFGWGSHLMMDRGHLPAMNTCTEWGECTLCAVPIHAVVVILKVVHINDYSWLNTAGGHLVFTSFCWVNWGNENFPSKKLFCLQATIGFWDCSSATLTDSFLADLPLAIICNPVHVTFTRYYKVGGQDLELAKGQSQPHPEGNKYPCYSTYLLALS